MVTGRGRPRSSEPEGVGEQKESNRGFNEFQTNIFFQADGNKLLLPVPSRHTAKFSDGKRPGIWQRKAVSYFQKV